MDWAYAQCVREVVRFHQDSVVILSKQTRFLIFEVCILSIKCVCLIFKTLSMSGWDILSSIKFIETYINIYDVK